jgi:NADPH:quinone reductase-like Zn-dependent oxidoreductase
LKLFNKMKAAVRSKYGLPGVLRIQELEIPIPKENELLIKVHATTVNRTDCHILWGRPFIMRLFTGLFKPRLAVTGTDFVGQIESIGSTVKSFKVGDKVMGFGGGFGCGSHAQYFTFPEGKALKAVITMPDNITYDQAAACIEGAFYGLNCVLTMNPKAGQNALVIGATGAIGSSTVQFLKLYGTYITAVCRGENSELVRSLGADKIIDYTTDDFTKDSEKYDFVFDSIGKNSFFKCKPLLKKNGMFTSSGGFENLFLVLITPLLGGKKVVFRAPKNIREGLNFIKDLVEKGSFKPVIDRKYPIDKIAEAFEYVGTGQKIGNVIIIMDT